jgi:hypothetical protein
MATGAWSAVAKLAARRHGAFTRKEAADSGLTARHIATAKARGLLDEPIPGVLIFAGSPETWRRRLMAIVLAGHERAWSSHRASCVLFGLDGFDDPDEGRKLDVKPRKNVKVIGKVKDDPALDVTVLQPKWLVLPPSAKGVVHQAFALDAIDLVSIDRIPCTGLARTLTDLGSVCSEETVWRALISARRKHDINPMWLQSTALRLHRPGPTGTPTIRRLLQRWAAEGVLPESWLEDLMGKLLNDPTIPGLVRQHEVRDANGRVVGRLDAAIPAAKLGFEGHSREFHFGPINEAADEDRDLRLMAEGYEVCYLGWYASKTPTEVLGIIRKIVTARLKLLADAA